MTDRVYPSSKPGNGTVPPPPAAAAAPAQQNPAKTHLYNPNPRLPYRPQPHHRRYTRRRFSCCCCCIWTTIVLLILILLAAIAATALYVLYRPHRPTFTISSFRTQTLNLTTSSDASSSRLSTLFNLTITTKNPNNHIVFFYELFSLSAISNSVQVGNGSIPALTMTENNATTIRAIISGSESLDAESASSLRSDLNKKKGLPLKIVIDTKVKVKIGKLKTKKVGIRVSCEGIKGVFAPKSKKTPSVAVTTDSSCKVDLRIKIWKFTFLS